MLLQKLIGQFSKVRPVEDKAVKAMPSWNEGEESEDDEDDDEFSSHATPVNYRHFLTKCILWSYFPVM